MTETCGVSLSGPGTFAQGARSGISRNVMARGIVKCTVSGPPRNTAAIARVRTRPAVSPTDRVRLWFRRGRRRSPLDRSPHAALRPKAGHRVPLRRHDRHRRVGCAGPVARAPPAGWPALASAAAWALACLVLLSQLFTHRRTRAVLAFAACTAVMTAWWDSIRPSDDRDWAPDVARTALPGSRATRWWSTMCGTSPGRAPTRAPRAGRNGATPWPTCRASTCSCPLGGRGDRARHRELPVRVSQAAGVLDRDPPGEGRPTRRSPGSSRATNSPSSPPTSATS